MVSKIYKLRIFNFLNCLSDILDWISPVLNDHHKQVALISLRIAEALSLSKDDKNNIVSAGILHDIGAVSLAERADNMRFEGKSGQHHADVGYHLIRIFKPMESAAELIRYHHIPWENGAGKTYQENPVPLGSRILFIADHIALLINRKEEILGQKEKISLMIKSFSGSMFDPDLVEVFLKLAEKEYFWLDLVSPLISKQLELLAKFDVVHLNNDELLSLASLIRRIIDFRSPFTASHSSGVSATATLIGQLAGLDKYTCFELKVAGFLHDLGKLAIPTEILEKPAKLTTGEFNQMRAHTFYTYRVLESIDDLQQINKFGSYHHERLDGTGYPFRLTSDDLPFGSKVMAVADVFTALTEDRPYRKGMTNEQTLLILEKMGENNKLDYNIVKLVKENIDKINGARIAAQNLSKKEYVNFLKLI